METRDDGSGIRCSEHPDAPHGFMRDASHSAGRYVCECEFWEPQGVKIHAGSYGEAWIAQDGPLLTDTKPLEQKPVAYVTGFHNGHCVIQPTDPAVVLPVGMALYRAPTEWVGLTDKEIQDLGYLSEKFDASNSEWFDRWGFARAIEAKLKEKNHG
jgi:hypothetical protein